MRRKIKIGFIAISLILLLAGVNSYFELTRLTASLQTLVDNGAKSISLSTSALDILQINNLKVVKFLREDNVDYKTFTQEETNLMDSLLRLAAESYPNSRELEVIKNGRERYRNVLNKEIDSTETGVYNWYIADYGPAYSEFHNSIKEFMIFSQRYVVKHTEKLKGDIYRTTMQSVVALSVSIAILFVFYLMINIFFITPVIDMTNALERYFVKGSTFKIKEDYVDELDKLKKHITELMHQLKEKL